MWRFWPETKGRTLEEMDSLFGEVDVASRSGAMGGAMTTATADLEKAAADPIDYDGKKVTGQSEAEGKEHGKVQVETRDA